jgi:site-specific DNA recombinase
MTNKKTINGKATELHAAVIYVRVSTDEQASAAHNLPAQERKCLDYCTRSGLDPLKIFSDAESGRTADRPEFQAMVKYCSENRTRVSHVVVADLSRFARSVLDQAKALETFALLNIKLCSVDESHIDGTAAGKLASNIHGAFNQFFSDSLSERTRFRMAEAVRAGRFPWPAPVGYLNTGGGVLAVDPERAPLVRRAFELAAQGSHATDAIRRTLGALGLRTKRGKELPRQTFHAMLRNELYAGWVCGAGLRAAGKHDAIITERLFADVQTALAGGVNGGAVPHTKQNPDFPLRGFVRCASCLKPLTGGHAVGRGKVRHARYWCWNKDCKSKVGVSKERIEEHFISLLGCLQPTDEWLAQQHDIAARAWSQRQERTAQDRRTLTLRLQEQQTLNQNLILAKLKGEVTQADFDVVKPGIAQAIADLEASQKALEMESGTMTAFIDATALKVIDLVAAWRSAGISERQELQTAVFPDGLPYSVENCFFEPGNSSLINEFSDLIQELGHVGVPGGI